MRLWLIVSVALAAITVVAAFHSVYEEDLDVAEAGFGSLKKGLKKVGKGTSKHLKTAVKKVGRYAKKSIKKAFEKAKEYLKEKLKNAIKSEGPICYGRACAFCLKFDLEPIYSTKFCAGIMYDRDAGSIKLAIKHKPNGAEDSDDDEEDESKKKDNMVFLYKKQITGVMKLPNCMTLPFINQICIQGITFKVTEKNLETIKTQHTNAEGCVVIVARNVSLGAKLCMKFENGKKKAKFAMLTAEEKDGTMYAAEAKTNESGDVVGFEPTKNLKSGDTVKDEDLPSGEE